MQTTRLSSSSSPTRAREFLFFTFLGFREKPDQIAGRAYLQQRVSVGRLLARVRVVASPASSLMATLRFKECRLGCEYAVHETRLAGVNQCPAKSRELIVRRTTTVVRSECTLGALNVLSSASVLSVP